MEPVDLPQVVFNLTQRVDQLAQGLHDLQVENIALRNIIKESIALKSSQFETMLEPQVSLPEHFSGNRKMYRQFKNACHLLFSMKPRTYPTERVKVLTTISFLRGEPRNWADKFFETEDPILGSLEAFFASMDALFQDTDIQLTAESSMRTRQKTRGGVYHRL
ncbi:protein LDOC1-like [Bombina bombina]|uniref:protein LDOC1-like n=1 Tax=Bombina bombina TaxID=8345 RepID=UPI00235A6CBE|nr:protein LDOC1-like [Bombina bombina]